MKNEFNDRHVIFICYFIKKSESRKGTFWWGISHNMLLSKQHRSMIQRG